MGERARRPGDEATRVTGVNPGHPAPTKCTCVVGAYRIRPVCFAHVGVWAMMPGQNKILAILRPWRRMFGRDSLPLARQEQCSVINEMGDQAHTRKPIS